MVIDTDVNEEKCDETANADILMTETAESTTVSERPSVSLAPVFSRRGRQITTTAKMSDFQLRNK